MLGDILGQIQIAILVLVPMVLSLSVHEYAHARAAFALGDRTAAAMGRMTLNPLSHIDFFGTILLPLLAIISGAPFFGWAKPVPINPLGFSRRISIKTGLLLATAAGPMSNMALAFAMPALLYFRSAFSISAPEPILMFIYFMLKINIVLAIFNLIPIPPLDGSRILMGLLPNRFMPFFAYIERNPIISLVALALLVTQGAAILRVPVAYLETLLLSLAGLEPL